VSAPDALELDISVNLFSPNKILRSFPPLDAKEIIALTVLIVRKIPEDLYAEMITHAK
jgi:cell cycle arrest protein BUB2